MKTTEILNPKTEEEIWNRIKILSPDEMLISCAKGGFLKGVQKAIKDGADINYRNETDGNSAIARASIEGHFNIASYLLKKNALICKMALICAMDRMDLFKEMLRRAILQECGSLEKVLSHAEEHHYDELADLF